MINFLFSVAIAFIVFGAVFNIVIKAEPYWYDEDDVILHWVGIFITALLWFIVLPVSVIIGIIYLLKLFTDKIANVILSQINKRKLKKEKRDEY